VADSDAISLKVIVEASRAVSELKRTQDAAKAAGEEFKKLSEAERAAVVEMAKLQAAARAAADEEKRMSAYFAEASRLRKEETTAFQVAARAAAEETKKFTAESARLAREQEKLSEAIEKTRDETAKLKAANDANSAALLASRSKLGLLLTSVEDLGDKLKEVSPLWGTMATTAVGSFARISVGVSAAVVGIAGLTMALGRHAAESENTDRAIRLLGGAYDRVRDATNDTVTAQDALRLQQGLVQSGLNVTGEQLAALTARARQFALATGGETTQALGEMLDAMRGLESEGLRKFGVTLNATGDRQRDFNSVVRSLSSSQTEAEQTARKWGTALSQVNDSSRSLQQTLTGSQRTMTEEVERTSRSFTRMTGNIAAALAQALDLNNVFQFWSDLFDRGANERRIAGDRTRMRSEDAGIERRNTLAALNRLRDAGYNVSALSQYAQSEGADLNELARIRGAAGVAAEFGTDGVRVSGAMRGLGSLPGVQRMLQSQNREDDSREMQRAGEIKARRASTSGGGSSSARAELQSAIREYQQAIADGMGAEAVLVMPEDMPRNRGETALAYYQRLTEMQREFNSAGRVNDLDAVTMPGQSEADAIARGEKQRELSEFADEQAARERSRRSRIAARDQGTRRMAREQSLGGRVASGLGFRTDDEGRIANFDGMAAGAELLTGTVNSLTSGLSTLFDTLVSGSADAGTAFQLFASNLLSELGKMAMNKGLFYTFEGIAALFTAPPAAPAYFAAGAGLLALGAGLGIAGAATRPQVPAAGAGDASSARSLAPRATSGGGGSRGLSPVTVVLSSLVPAGPGDAQRLGRGLNDARRRGALRDTIPRRLEH
jgi:hypothetical protein